MMLDISFLIIKKFMKTTLSLHYWMHLWIPLSVCKTGSDLLSLKQSMLEHIVTTFWTLSGHIYDSVPIRQCLWNCNHLIMSLVLSWPVCAHSHNDKMMAHNRFSAHTYLHSPWPREKRRASRKSDCFQPHFQQRHLLASLMSCICLGTHIV